MRASPTYGSPQSAGSIYLDPASDSTSGDVLEDSSDRTAAWCRDVSGAGAEIAGAVAIQSGRVLNSVARNLGDAASWASESIAGQMAAASTAQQQRALAEEAARPYKEWVDYATRSQRFTEDNRRMAVQRGIVDAEDARDRRAWEAHQQRALHAPPALMPAPLTIQNAPNAPLSIKNAPLAIKNVPNAPTALADKTRRRMTGKVSAADAPPFYSASGAASSSSQAVPPQGPPPDDEILPHALKAKAGSDQIIKGRAIGTWAKENKETLRAQLAARNVQLTPSYVHGRITLNVKGKPARTTIGVTKEVLLNKLAPLLAKDSS